jgi:hypothetical protein
MQETAHAGSTAALHAAMPRSFSGAMSWARPCRRGALRVRITISTSIGIASTPPTGPQSQIHKASQAITATGFNSKRRLTKEGVTSSLSSRLIRISTKGGASIAHGESKLTTAPTPTISVTARPPI